MFVFWNPWIQVLGIPTPEAFAQFLPGPGNFRGTCRYHCRQKCVFRVSKNDFENGRKLTFDYSILATGNLGEPSSSQKKQPLDLGGLLKYASCDSPPDIGYEYFNKVNVLFSKQYYHTFQRNYPSQNDCFWVVQKVPRGTFWGSWEPFSEQNWNSFSPLKFGVYAENRDLVCRLVYIPWQ